MHGHTASAHVAWHCAVQALSLNMVQLANATNLVSNTSWAASTHLTQTSCALTYSAI